MMPAALPGRIECPAVMSQWVQTSQRSEIAAGESTRSRGLGLQSTAHCCNGGGGKKGGERWDAEKNGSITKGRQNEPETIRCTESVWGVEGDRSEQRKQIQNKRRSEKKKEWRVKKGMEWGWSNLNFLSSSLSPFNTTQFGNRIRYDSCTVQASYRAITNSNNILITHHGSFLYFHPLLWLWIGERASGKLSSRIIPWVMFGKYWNVFFFFFYS